MIEALIMDYDADWILSFDWLDDTNLQIPFKLLAYQDSKIKESTRQNCQSA